MREQEPSMVWLVLKYLLISYNDDKDYKSYKEMGEAIILLHNMNFLTVNSIEEEEKKWIKEALTPCLDSLKVTFDPAPHDVLSKILGDVTNHYQFCVSFQVRPVLIAFKEETTEGYRVGIDSAGNIRDDGGIFISESLEKALNRSFKPDTFDLEIKQIKVFDGSDSNEDRESKYDISKIKATLSGKNLEISKSREFNLQCIIQLFERNKCLFTANSHILKSTHEGIPIHSKIINLLPYIRDIQKSGTDFEIEGSLLGRAEDRVIVEFYHIYRGNEKCVLIFNEFKDEDFDNKQQKLTLRREYIHLLIPGTYFIIVRVNNQKSKKKEVEL